MQDGMKFCYLEVIYLYKACEEVLPFLKHLAYLFLYNGHALSVLERQRNNDDSSLEAVFGI